MWGVDHEKVTGQEYYQLESDIHTLLTINECGRF